MKLVRRLLTELGEMSWTLGGTGLVLITLSGETRTLGIWISVVALVIHVIGIFASSSEEE